MGQSGKRWAARHISNARCQAQPRERIRVTSASVNVRQMAVSAVLAATVMGALACTPKADAPSPARDTVPAPADSINLTKERSEDLTGDGSNERITVTARGSRMDSLRVRLEIRSADDSLLYASSWSSRFYFQYLDRASIPDAAADSIVRRHLDAVLADSAFRTGTPGPAADTMRATMMRDAIRYDIATNQLRTRHGLALGAEIPPSAHDSINTLATAVPKSQIDALFEELRGKRSFTYFAGGEVTYSIAWSQREQRFVTIFSCC